MMPVRSNCMNSIPGRDLVTFCRWVGGIPQSLIPVTAYMSYTVALGARRQLERGCWMAEYTIRVVKERKEDENNISVERRQKVSGEEQLTLEEIISAVVHGRCLKADCAVFGLTSDFYNSDFCISDFLLPGRRLS
jgi:hypothetical protein